MNITGRLMLMLSREGVTCGRCLRLFGDAVSAAVITPPDVASQIIVAVPVLLLYQISIHISSVVLKREAKNQQKDAESRR